MGSNLIRQIVIERTGAKASAYLRVAVVGVVSACPRLGRDPGGVPAAPGGGERDNGVRRLEAVSLVVAARAMGG
jgi:hypothetical protein